MNTIPWDTVERELRGAVNHFHKMSELPDISNERALAYIHAAQEINERLQRLLCTMIDTNVQEGRTEHSHGGHGTDASTEADDKLLLSWCVGCKSIQVHTKHPMRNGERASKSCNRCYFRTKGWEQVQVPTRDASTEADA